jgi:hypothetical protein
MAGGAVAKKIMATRNGRLNAANGDVSYGACIVMFSAAQQYVARAAWKTVWHVFGGNGGKASGVKAAWRWLLCEGNVVKRQAALVMLKEVMPVFCRNDHVKKAWRGVWRRRVVMVNAGGVMKYGKRRRRNAVGRRRRSLLLHQSALCGG